MSTPPISMRHHLASLRLAAQSADWDGAAEACFLVLHALAADGQTDIAKRAMMSVGQGMHSTTRLGAFLADPAAWVSRNARRISRPTGPLEQALGVFGVGSTSLSHVDCLERAASGIVTAILFEDFPLSVSSGCAYCIRETGSAAGEKLWFERDPVGARTTREERKRCNDAMARMNDKTSSMTERRAAIAALEGAIGSASTRRSRARARFGAEIQRAEMEYYLWVAELLSDRAVGLSEDDRSVEALERWRGSHRYPIWPT